MLAFVVHNERLRPVHKPLPRLRPGWALVGVRLAGICNTDLEILRGYHGFRGTPGHEFVGDVVRVNSRSSKDQRWVGRRVTGEINIGCAALDRKLPCAFCKRGIVAHCKHRRVLGILGHDGAFAEYLALPLMNLHRIAGGLADERAVFTEPLAAACQILEQVRVEHHREAAVLGDGKLAQLVARVLRATGLKVTMFGRHATKLALARSAGIATVKLQEGALPVRFRQHYSLLVEATGSPTGLALAQAMTTPRGTVVLKSTFHGVAKIELWPVVVNELTVLGSRCGPFARALEFLVRNPVRQIGHRNRPESGHSLDPSRLISKVFPLREAPAAIQFAARRGVMKVLLKP